MIAVFQKRGFDIKYGEGGAVDVVLDISKG
jgi:hypothetical protein